VNAVTDDETAERVALAKEIFTLDESVNADDLAWGARVSVGLDRLVSDFDLDSIAYYHRGLEGELHERLAAGMILGASPGPIAWGAGRGGVRAPYLGRDAGRPGDRAGRVVH